MGASTFFQKGQGQTLEEAFNAAVDYARYMHGHAGYSGTLAEKHDVVLVSDTPHTVGEAQALADSLIEQRDPRIDDKWGPAGAIRIDKTTWLFFGWASD